MLSFKYSGALVTKGINHAGNAALVSEVSADPALVPNPANEGAVEDETILRCSDSNSRSLGKETARMGDEPRPHSVTDEGGQVGCQQGHFVLEVGRELFAIVGQPNNTAGKHVDVTQKHWGDIHTHGRLAHINKSLGSGAIHQNCLNIFQHALVELLVILDKLDYLGVECILWDNSDQLWEMVRVPFSDTHAECVGMLVSRNNLRSS